MDGNKRQAGNNVSASVRVEMNKVLEEDLDKFAREFPFIPLIKGKTILVTGATGLIGSLIVRVILRLNAERDAGVSVIACGRNMEKAEKLFGETAGQWIFQDLSEPIPLGINADYVFHCAAVTDSKTMVEKPVEVFTGILKGTENILEFCRKSRVESMVFLSSIEVYGSNGTGQLIKEGDSGHIDAMNVRSCYPLGKKAAEFLCVSYHTEYGVPVRIARLTQTFGPGISSADNRVFAQFARSVMRDENIVLHTSGESAKPYCYTMDALNALFYILLKGKSGEAYNVANPATYVSVLEMAKIVTEKFGKESKVDFQLRDDLGYAPTTKINMDTARLEQLGWRPVTGLEEMYSRLINYLKEENEGADA